MSEERLRYKHFTGRPQAIVSNVRRVISAFTREDRVHSFKIGITNNPERRFKRRHIKKYDKMIVVYRSSSINSVSELEDKLIEHNKELADNKRGGGGGDYGAPPYYLYVVIKY